MMLNPNSAALLRVGANAAQLDAISGQNRADKPNEPSLMLESGESYSELASSIRVEQPPLELCNNSFGALALLQSGLY